MAGRSREERSRLLEAEAVELELARRVFARRSFLGFMRVLYPDLHSEGFHETYYRLLDLFAHGVVRNLVVTMPPQHGKSEGSTRRLPAYMLGLDPSLRVCIASYAFPLAQGFNRSVQQVMTLPFYNRVFPDTVIPKSEASKALDYDPAVYVRNTRELSIIGKQGKLLAVGRGGALTGNPVDVAIIDDLYKDDKEANSPLIREAAWEWYTDVLLTRLHNGSQKLITFTRWSEDDVIGRLMERGGKGDNPRFIQIDSLDMFSDLSRIDRYAFYCINFPALKLGPPTDIDPREAGEALWEDKHGALELRQQRAANPLRFESLYQGNPIPTEGLLYGLSFATYERFPDGSRLRGMYAYVDSADSGSDFHTALVFGWGLDDRMYLKDVLYTQLSQEATESLTADIIMKHQARLVWVESNNGGKGFARNIRRIMQERSYRAMVVWFHQSSNKESRILTASADVQSGWVMPDDWSRRWPEFWKAVVMFRRLFKANAHDDAPDALTGALEKTILGTNSDALYSI